MDTAPRIDAYHFYEEEWGSYDELQSAFEWVVPDEFNMAEYVCDRHAGDRGRVALFAEDADGNEETYTFWELRNEANRLANYLEAQGVERGDRVGINTPQIPETLIAHVAAWKLGAVSVPLSTLFGPDAIRYRLDDCRAVAAVVDGSNVEAFRTANEDLDALRTVVTTGGVAAGDETAFDAAIDGQSRAFETATTAADDDAVMVYTSGTTGSPKGVLHGHRVLLGYLPGVLTVIYDLEIRDDDFMWAPPEWAWVGSLFAEVLPTMYYGVPQLAYDADGPFEAETAFSLFEKYDVTITFLPPTAMRMMMQVDDPDDRWDLDSVRLIMSGGESVGGSLVDWAEDVFDGAVIHEAYGQTEFNILIGDCTALFPFREGKMGRACIGRDVGIVEPGTAEPLERGEAGEIAVRYADDDPGRFKEYWEKPEKTAEKVVDGWMLTEDRGVMDEDGYVSFGGRTDDVIISAGYRIGPEEVEEAVARHEAVADAGVIGVPDETRGEVPKAYAVLAPGYDPSEELKDEIRSFVKDNLAKYEYPREIEFVDELPMTATGKIQRFQLREWHDEGR